MKKGIAILAAVVLALVAYLYLGPQKEGNQQAAAVPAPAIAPTVAPNDLPMLPLTLTNGTKLMAKNLQGKTVLVLFQPDCDHCQREATQIREHLSAFDGYNIYFISPALLKEQIQFAQDFNLADLKNVFFARVPGKEIIDQLGPVTAPSVFVYSELGQLKESFLGETPMEEILAVL